MADLFSLHLLYYSWVQNSALYYLRQKIKKCRLYSEQAVLRNGAQLHLEGEFVKWNRKLRSLKRELENDNTGATILHYSGTCHPQYLQVWGFFCSRIKYISDWPSTVGASGIVVHLFWKQRRSHLIASIRSWITDVTGTVPDHKLLKKNISC